jgi:TetR/AcrR family transcriptional regulator, transcriptional repressor for nem operon
MRYPVSETAEKHTRILNEATRLFRERGFADASVSEIMNAAGLTHGSFYNHFSSKEALMAASVEHGIQNSVDSVNGMPRSSQGKAQHIARYLSATHRDAVGKGCVMAALVSDVRQEPQVRGPFTTQVKAVIEKLASHFPWRSNRSARGDSIRILSSMLGALILARAVDDDAFSKEILREARKGLL